jgi:hypothetical protein
MTPDVRTGDVRGTDVMASVDDAAGTPEFVIADVSRDGAWLSVALGDAPELDDWR